MQVRVLWCTVGGFLLGVLARSLFDIPWPFTVALVTLAAALLALGFLEPPRRRASLLAAVALLAWTGGVVRMDAARLVSDAMLDTHLGKTVTLLGVVAAEPDVRESSERITLRAYAMRIGSTTAPVRAGVLVVAPAHAGVSYGDEVEATGQLRVPESFETTRDRSFDYPMFLAKDGVLYELSFARVERIGSGAGNPIVAAAIAVKQLYLQGERAALSEPAAGLAGGITVGDKRSIGKELSADFQRVSLVHMVVLSGYNITIVMNVMRSLVQFFPRYVQYSTVGFAVAFFVLMTGGAASAVRAGAMALVAVLARATGRVFLAGRILGVVAFLMVLWNPLTLVFDPSFQLSALATLGLIYVTPLVEPRVRFMTERFALREILASTIATQAAVLPLLLYQNGTLSLVSLPANLLALVAVPLAMAASAFAAAVGIGAVFVPAVEPMASLAGVPAYLLLSYIIAVAQFFASLPLAAVLVPAFSVWWMVCAYALMAALVLRLHTARAAVVHQGPR